MKTLKTIKISEKAGKKLEKKNIHQIKGQSQTSTIKYDKRIEPVP